MNVVTAVEVRTTRPVYFGGEKGQQIHLAVQKGRGIVTMTERVKVTALSTGKYSIRTLGKGGLRKTVYVYPKTFVLMVTEDGDNLFGKVEDLFAAAQG